MAEGDHLIYFREDQNIVKGLKDHKVHPQVHEISLQEMTAKGGYYDQEEVRIDYKKGTLTVSREDISLNGNHNMINVMCAVFAALIAGAEEAPIKEGLQSFKNAAHRMERVEEIDGVTYINDSKGTNVDATAYALAAFNEPLIRIAGGVDKGNDYKSIYPLVKDHVKLLICLGK